VLVWRWNKAVHLALSLYERLKTVPDCRSARKKKHNQAEILTYIIFAYLIGKTSLRRAVAWAERNINFLRKFMALEGGIASAPTISRILSNIDEYAFGLVFIEWISEILKCNEIEISIDGKALRGALDKRKQKSNVPYVLNALDVASELVIAQIPIDAKKNEITFIPKLLDLLDLTENIITIDAIGTQVKIMEMIIDKGGHFLFTVKKNNKSVYEEILGYSRQMDNTIESLKRKNGKEKELEETLEKIDEVTTKERNRERNEYRNLKTYPCDPLFFTREAEVYMKVKTIGCLTQVRIPVERDENGVDITRDLETFLKEGSYRKPKVSEGDDITDDIQKVGLITDMDLKAEEMLAIH